MKKIIQIFLFLAMAQCSIAQSDTIRFEITISDPAAISSTSPTVLPLFANAAFNSILSSYYITEFKPAYPSARMQYLRNVYQVQCNSIALATDLKSASVVTFPTWDRSSKKNLVNGASILTIAKPTKRQQTANKSSL